MFQVIYNWEEGTHLVIKEGYGQTETTLLIGTFKKMSKWVKPGSMGKVAPGYDVRIVNNMGKVSIIDRLICLLNDIYRVTQKMPSV